MILYADTSALAQLIIPEDGSSAIREAVRQAVRTVSTEIAYVEFRAAVGAASRDNRLAVSLVEAVAELEQVWRRIGAISPDPDLIRAAGDLCDQFALRGYAAIHIQSLMTQPKNETSFACWDKDLRRAVADLGYKLIPETLD